MTSSQALNRLKSLEEIISQKLKEYDQEVISKCPANASGYVVSSYNEFNYAMRELTKSIADMESELLELYRENKRLKSGEED